MKHFDTSQCKPQIDFSDFAKLDLRVGEVAEAESVEMSNKLLKLLVDFGDFKKTIYAGIKQWYNPEDLKGRKFIFVVNLAPKEFKFGISEGMIVAAGEREAVLYTFDKDLPAGTQVR